jgi:O-antigen ligase
MSTLHVTVPATPPCRAVPRHGLGFALFLAVNAVLFVRPAEVFPPLLGVEIYQYLILACLACSFPAVLEKVAPRALEAQPVSLCVASLLPAVALSLLSHLYLGEAWDHGVEFAKVLVYYFLLVALVDSPARLRALLTWLGVFTAAAAALAVLDYHGVLALPKLPPPPGKEAVVRGPDGAARMVGTGLFQDPNDLCVLLVVGIVLALHKHSDRRAGPLRLLWLGPLGLFAYGFSLTQSRGGLLALAAGLGVTVRLRYGWGRALLLGAVALPVLGAVLGARQMQISTDAETATERIQLWSDGLVMFRQAPLFGVGMNHYGDGSTHAAHNSYLHAFAELGLLGGGLFLGAVYLAVRSLYSLTWPPPPPPGRPTGPPRLVLDPELRHLYPYLAGMVTAYATGMLTLSLTYIAPTYTVLGLAAAFLPLASTRPPQVPEGFDARLVLRLGLLSVAFLAGMQVFVRVFFQG